MIKLAGEFGTRVHIVHHSSSNSLPLLQDARSSGLKLTVETCPHYLTFAAEEIPDGATEFKCCPPIRERENRELLWKALEYRHYRYDRFGSFAVPAGNEVEGQR